MQIDKHVKVVFSAPVTAVSQIPEAAFDRLSVFSLQHIVIDRNSDMIKAKAGNVFDVLFRDEGVKVRDVVFGKL